MKSTTYEMTPRPRGPADPSPTPAQPLERNTYFSSQTASFSSLWPLWPSEVWLALLLKDEGKR